MTLIDRDLLLDWLEDERDVCLQHGNCGEASEASYIQKHVMEMPRVREADLLMNKIAGSAFFSAAEKGKIQAAVEKEPGEDVKPVVHAHWIKSNYDYVDGTIYKCSNCNTEMFSAWNYCPHCGAKMIESQESEVTE